MEQTRLRILEAMADVLADEAVDEVTIPIVAMRARVSVRTVYRHFPTKEALFDAFGEWAEEHLRLVLHSYPETLEGVREMAPALYRMYDERRAADPRPSLEAGPGDPSANAPPAAEDVREGDAGADATDLEPAEQRRRAIAVVYLLVSAPAWQAMRDQWGLDGAGGRAGCRLGRARADRRASPEPGEHQGG